MRSLTRQVIAATIGLLVIVLVAAFGFALDDPPNTDPRQGRVTIDESNCLSDCYTLYEICVGPDLLIVYNDGNSSERDITRTEKNSPECLP